MQTVLTPHNFLLPLFVHDGEDDIPIGAMPGCNRLGWCGSACALALRRLVRATGQRSASPNPGAYTRAHISACCRKTGLLREVREARAVGVNSVVIFPKTPDHLKTPTGEEAFNPNGARPTGTHAGRSAAS